MKDTIWIKKGRFTPLAVVLMFALPLVTALICLCFGRMSVPIGEVLSALRTALTGESTSNVQNYSIVINLRLPRILMAIIVGAGLSCAGNTYQSLFSNPLATPDILGVTSGTCVGAILAIILSCSILETQLIALVFGLISVCFTLKIAGKSDGRSMVYLVLAGTIASSLFNALGSLLGSVVLGVCIIIAGSTVAGSVKKLTAAVDAQTFASSYASPSNLTVSSTADKKYLTETEAAAYLNMPVEEIKAAITKGEIEQYVKTSSGYTISVEELDKFFGQKAYDTMTSNNSSASEE